METTFIISAHQFYERRKRCGGEGVGFELTIDAAADPARYAAWLGPVSP
jgi:hypothetical protein